MSNGNGSSKQAVVIGGSMAGLMAAAALADHFERVTIVERDTPPAGPAARKGVPQGNHAHAILKKGEQMLECLFPGFWDEMAAMGSNSGDMAENMRWFQCGAWKPRQNSGLTIRTQSRPLLEWNTRRRVADLPNVTFQNGTTVTGLMASADNKRVIGIRFRRNGEQDALLADLVVDASGRGSQTPKWLRQLGYAAPPETEYPINLSYASRVVELAPGKKPDYLGLILNPRVPEGTKYGYAFAIEDNKWIVTLTAYAGDVPPLDREGWLAFARQLPQPTLSELLQGARFIGAGHVYKYKAEKRRHYEKLRRFPESLVVLGDAMASFDPVFGQGMSVAALEVEILSAMLAGGKWRGLGRRFQRRAARAITLPWAMSTGEGRRYPAVEPNPPMGLRFMHWYNDQLFELIGTDVALYHEFLHVMHMIRPPFGLFGPSVFWRALRHWWRQRRRADRPVAEMPELAPGD